MSMGSGKIKPEDLFNSLKIIKEQSVEEPKSFAESFFDKFSDKMSEQAVIQTLKGTKLEIEGYL